MSTKEPESAKIPQGVFLSDQKEPVIARIAQLVERYPSRRQAAQVWGVNYSTLQNYFKRSSEEPTPRKGVLESISRHEGVSVEWLLTGIGGNEDVNKTKKAHKEPIPTFENPNLCRIVDLLKLLKENELAQLANVLGLKGIETILHLLDENSIKLLQLPVDEKDRLWALHEAKKGASEDSSGDALTLPTHKAG